MLRIVFLLFFVALVTTSCSQTIHEDPTAVDAIRGGYPTAEFRACGKLWHGVGVCRIAPGESYSKLEIAVQGYYQGTTQIESKSCGVSTLRRYTNNELVSVSVPEKASDNCLFTFQVFPEYPGQDHAGVNISGFKGMLWVRLLAADQAWTSTVVKRTGNWSQRLKMFSGGDGPVTVKALGCDHDYLNTLPLVKGYVTFPIDQAVSSFDAQCILEGLVVNPVYKNLMFSVPVIQYSSLFTPLPIPSVSVVGGQLNVKADPAVSIIALDEAYTVNNTASFEFDTAATHTLRVFTVKGRSVIGTYNPREGVWSWLQ